MNHTFKFLNGGGAMGERLRNHNWSSTTLGPPDAWPQSLRSAVALTIRTPQPACLFWGPDQILIYNEGYVAFLGVKHPASFGRPAAEVWAEIWETLEPITAAAFAGEAQRFEEMPFTLAAREQKAGWFSFSYTPLLDEKGDVAGLYNVATETTDKVLAEQHLKTSKQALHELNQSLEHQVTVRTQERDRLWRNTQDVQLVVDGQGVLKAVSPAFTTILGWTSDDVCGRNVFDFILPDEEASQEAFDHARTGNLLIFENRYRHKNGGFRWFSWVATPEADLVYASGRHITAEKEQAAALAIAGEALRHSQKMEAVGQLTGGIAHDFNNMLATITSSLELMSRRIASGKGGDLTRYLTLASTAAQSAAALIKRLLAFSRKQTLDLQTLDINASIAQIEDMLRRSIGESIQFELALQPGLPTVKSDRNQLENALLNLCINARDAMPEGGLIRISTSTRELDAGYASMHPEVFPGPYVMVSVSDNGTGMSPEIVAKAFDPFFTTKPIGQGTGLGLSMIYGFARQTQGHASIHSVVGEGTTVNVYLPCNLTSLETPVTQQQSVARSPKGQGETVLFVEDEPGVRAVLGDILGELGYATQQAIDAPSALAVEQGMDRLDLLITDVGLPGTNGRQLAEMMRERRPGLKVLFITGYAHKAMVKGEYLDEGMDMLAKPFTIDALAHKVTAMLNDSVRD